jgi:hypothetical protein
MRTRLPGHAGGDVVPYAPRRRRRPAVPGHFALKVGFRRITEPRLPGDPVMTADDKDEERDAPGNESSRDLVPHELRIRPNYDLNAIEFEVADQDGRGFVITIYDQDMPEILLESLRAWARLDGSPHTP